MTTTDPALPTSGDGGGLKAVVRAAVIDWNTLGTGKVYADVSSFIAERVNEHVASLLSQARADGEEKGAAKERTRRAEALERVEIMAALDPMTPTYVGRVRAALEGGPGWRTRSFGGAS